MEDEVEKIFQKIKFLKTRKKVIWRERFLRNSRPNSCVLYPAVRELRNNVHRKETQWKKCKNAA